MLGELAAFKERNSGSMSFNYGSSSASERSLKNWVSKVRSEYRRLRFGQPSTLTAERIQKLNGVGFDFEPTANQDKYSWGERIEQLVLFVAKNDHCRIPIGHPQLGNFVSGVRGQYKNREEGKENALCDERLVCHHIIVSPII